VKRNSRNESGKKGDSVKTNNKKRISKKEDGMKKVGKKSIGAASAAKKYGYSVSGKGIVSDVRYVVFEDVFASNPGGDFDNGNRPKTFNNARGQMGEISDVTLKRGIRDWVLYEKDGVPGMGIFVQAQRPLDSVIRNQIGKRKDVDLVKEMCRELFDVRTHGAVLIGGRDSGSENAEGEGGEEDSGKSKNVGTGITGPVVVEDAVSLDPVEITDRTLTRIAPTNTKRGNHSVGRRSFIRYARYRFGVYVEGFRAKQTGFTYKDLEVLEGALKDVYRYRRSAARPNIRTTAVYKIEPVDPKSTNSMAMDEAMDRIQCSKVKGAGEYLDAGSYVFPEPFKTKFVRVTRIK